MSAEQSPERLAGVIPVLQYEELLRPGQEDQVLDPNEIPIHPQVYGSSQVYTSEFARMVAQAVPDSIRRDLEAMSRVLGTDFDLDVDGSSIAPRSTAADFRHSFDRFEHITYPLKRRLDVSYGTSNIAVVRPDRGRIPYFFQPSRPHPMPTEKLAAYGFDPNDKNTFLISWYIHNLATFGLPVRMYFRNFAIMFNNLGLQHINKLK